jgi:formylglycine-generating enzyme required for sulfatase activity
MNTRISSGAMFLILGLASLAARPAQCQDVSWPDLSSPPPAVGGGERDAAVIVGAENYFVVEHVPGARQNANDWQSYLTGTLNVPADRVALLLDGDATNDAIRQAAVEKAAQVEPGGTLWFIFIGHGAPSQDGRDGLLVGVDAQEKAASIYSRSFSRNQLLGILAKGRQAKTVVLLDACFSGKTPSGQFLVAGLQPLVAVRAANQGLDSRTILMTAAKSDQFAGPLPGGSRPAFSYLALGALRGWAADARGKITAQALVDYVRRVLSFARDRTQTPELSTPEAARIVLGTGRETGPDLAQFQREAASSSGSVIRGAKPRASAGQAGIRWVKIPGGSFVMGDDVDSDSVPRHQVTLSSFEMAKTLVTNKQYKACVTAGACTPAHFSDGTCFVWDGPPWRQGILPGSFQEDDQPVVCVSRDQAWKFSRWVGGRLPTEAEWEYAARSAGKDWEYPWGDEMATCERAVILEGGDGCGINSTWSVCSKPEGNTEQGLCDMAGNVWEFTEDSYHSSYNGAPADGSAWRAGGFEDVVRGGSLHGDAQFARGARRGHYVSGRRGEDTGFRPVR